MPSNYKQGIKEVCQGLIQWILWRVEARQVGSTLCSRSPVERSVLGSPAEPHSAFRNPCSGKASCAISPVFLPHPPFSTPFPFIRVFLSSPAEKLGESWLSGRWDLFTSFTAFERMGGQLYTFRCASIQADTAF